MQCAIYLVRSLRHLNVGSLWYIINTFYCGCDAHHAYQNPLHPAEVSTISQIILHVKGLQKPAKIIFCLSCL